MQRFSFTSYYWNVGTTSFRTAEFNVQIERQLDLLGRFWDLPSSADKMWQDLQVDYYYFMKKNKFVTGDAHNPAKDAREKTSGLTDIGLIDGNRKLTAAGAALLNVSQQSDFNRNNTLQLPADSIIYLKQLLKTSVNVEENTVRPFTVTVYALLRLEYLSKDEFTYLLPLCTTRENTEIIISNIENSRAHKDIDYIDKIITSRFMAMDNYKKALNYFVANDVTENVIIAVGMNRKSGKYDEPYYWLYELLHTVIFDRDTSSILPLYEQCGELNTASRFWRTHLFNKTLSKDDGLAALNDVPLRHVSDETEFKQLFFEQMHLFKAKATLEDYADLNERYFKTTDAVIFDDSKVALDVLPKCWFLSVSADDLLSIAFTKADNLTEDADMSDIAPFLAIDERKIYANIKTLYGISATTDTAVSDIIKKERYTRLNNLIANRFHKEVLIDLFEKFERRNDDAIRKAVTKNADIPTIFEYILGIAWYIISGRRGDILSYMKLSLEADLLPRTHASGGNANIVYLYEATENYPAHCLLLEATLTEEKNQRRMEMEPVSRHLGEYILHTGDKDSYCVFVSNALHLNLISDFRNRKTYTYYGKQPEKSIYGLKILPLAAAELRIILEHGIGYDRLYSLFEAAYNSDKPIPMWYESEIVNKIKKLILSNCAK